MGELHIDGLAPLVVVEIIADGVFKRYYHIVDNDGKTPFIEER